jgi:hypothetical protein
LTGKGLGLLLPKRGNIRSIFFKKTKGVKMSQFSNIRKLISKVGMNGNLSTISIIGVLTFFGFIVMGAFLSGCGGGGGSSDNAPALEGTFVDSPVEGLEYNTPTQSGVTDANGTFRYMAGEKVTFSLGNMVLGDAMGKPVMTPIDMVVGATDEFNPMVTNMARFLQTLDADMDLANGITITDEVADLMLNHMINFNMNTADFSNDPNHISFMDALNAMNPSGPMHMLVPAVDAQNHLRNSMNQMMNNGSGGMSSGNNMMN